MKPTDTDLTKDSLTCMAADLIVISSDESSDSDMKILFSKNEHKWIQRNTKEEEDDVSQSDVIDCSNCLQKFENLQGLKDHIEKYCMCFFPLTRQFWQNERHLCQICGAQLLSHILLRRHCFDNPRCKLEYVELFMEKMKSENSINAKLENVNGMAASSSPTSLCDHSYASRTTTAISHVPHVENSNSDVLHSSENVVNQQDKGNEPRDFNSTNTSFQRNNSSNLPAANNETFQSNNTNRRQLRHRKLGIIKPCFGCGREFKSVKDKRKHLAASVKCYKQIGGVQACLCCKNRFADEDRKTEHLNSSWECQKYLLEIFHSGKFLNSVQIHEDYNLNRNMCHFCMFTSNDGNVFNHILIALKCRQKFEEAILKYENNTESLVTFPNAESAVKTSKQFTCNLCKKNFNRIANLKTHELRMHNGSLEEINRRREKRQNELNHLYCLSCLKFLKSDAEVRSHQCSTDKLLSRFWYKKAVWKKDEYQCKYCHERLFGTKYQLRKHMQKHEDKRSPLFNAIANISKQSEVPQREASNFSHKADGSSTAVCYSEPMLDKNVPVTLSCHGQSADFSTGVCDTTEKNQHLAHAKNRLQQFKRLLKLRKTFKCENCERKFYMSKVFIKHVLTNHECLLHYKNPRKKSQLIIPFCFKCEKNFIDHKTFMQHECGKEASFHYKCQYCSKHFISIINKRSHENIQHKFEKLLRHSEQNDTCISDVTTCRDTIYNCKLCHMSFQSQNHFVKHILLVHTSCYSN